MMRRAGVRAVLVGAALAAVVVVSWSGASGAGAAGSDAWVTRNCRPTCSGYISSIDFVDDEHGWVGTSAGQIARTTDAGLTWRLSEGRLPGAIDSVRFATRELGFAVGDFKGVLRSRDGGKTWAHLLPFNHRAHDLEVVDARTVYAGGYDGSSGRIQRSTDGGTVWRSVATAWSSFEVEALDPDHLWAASSASIGSALLHSTDGGTTWPVISPMGPDDMSFVDAEHGWAIGKDNYFGWVQHTEDGGHTWTAQDCGRYCPRLYAVGFVDTATGVAVGERAILETFDGGATWAKATTLPPSYGESNYLAVDVVGDTVWVAGNGQVVLARNAPTLVSVTTHPWRSAGIGALAGAALAGVGTLVLIRRAGGIHPIVGAVTSGLLVIGGVVGVTTSDEEVAGPEPIGTIADDATFHDPSTSTTAPSTSTTSTSTSSTTSTSAPPASTSTTTSVIATTTTTKVHVRSTVGPTNLTATCTPTNNGYVVTTATTKIVNTKGARSVTWTASPTELVYDPNQNAVPWASVSPAKGSVAAGSTATVTITPSRFACDQVMQGGTQHHHVVVTRNDGPNVTVTVTLSYAQ